MRRHELDVASLLTGLVFVAIAVVYLVGQYTDAHISAGWVLPLGLIGLGVAGLTGSLRRGLQMDRPRDEPGTGPLAQDPGGPDGPGQS